MKLLRYILGSAVLVLVLSFFFSQIQFNCPGCTMATDTTFATSTSPSIVISEIGAYEADNHEWVELFNISDTAIDISSWVFWEGGVHHKLQLAEGNSFINPKSFAIIAEDATQFKIDYPHVSVTIFDSSWGSLNESGEEIGLKNEVGGMVELFTYVPATEHALERIDVHSFDYTHANWKEHASGNSLGKLYEEAEEELETEEIELNHEAEIDFEGKVTSTEQSEMNTEQTTASSETVPESNVLSTTTEVMSTTTRSISTSTEQTAEQIIQIHPTSTNDFAHENSATSTYPTYAYQVGDIVINEFVSSPETGQSEFVELKNISLNFIDISGWYLQDGSGAKTYLNGGMHANSLYVIEKPKGSLNNGGDSLFIFDKTGANIFALQYGSEIPAPEKGESIARGVHGEYVITTYITKGQENKFSPRYIDEDEEEPRESTEKESAKKQDEKEGKKKTYKQKDTQKHKDKTDQDTDTQPKIKKDKRGNNREQQKSENIQKGYDAHLKKIQISEFMPDPSGDDADEFIELYNPTDSFVSLNGLALDDADGGSKPFIVSEGVYIKPHSFIVFVKDETGISLNNTKDEVRLLIGTEVVHRIAYEKAKEDAAYANIDNVWQWTTRLTPGSSNMADIAFIDGEEAISTAVTHIEKQESKIRMVEMASVREIELNTEVMLKGTVSVLPGVLSPQYFYVHDTPELGVEIYMYKKDFPRFSLGDVVEVRGVVSGSKDKKRIRISEKKDMRVLSKGPIISPVEMSIGEISSEHIGNLVVVSGSVVSLKKSGVVVDDGTGEAQVAFKKGANINYSALRKEGNVIISGIVLAYKDTFTIVPRANDDVLMQKDDVPTTTEKMVPEVESITLEKKTTSHKDAIISLCIILTAGIGFGMRKLKK